MGLPFESTDPMRCILLIKKIKTKENFVGNQMNEKLCASVHTFSNQHVCL